MLMRLLKNSLSPQRRVQIMQSLPRPLRHRLVDIHVTWSRRKFRKALNKGAQIGLQNKTPVEVWVAKLNAHSTNVPEFYVHFKRHFDIDRLMHYAKHFAIKGKILDFGCNAGRVLRHFTDAGYGGIGVEIDASALELGKKVHPSLNKAELYAGDGETVLPKLPSQAAEYGYSIAVLRHVSPQTIDAVVGQLCRVVSGYFITIEDEASISPLSFPYDYVELFAKHGWHQIGVEYGVDWPEFEGSTGTMLRIFSPKP